MNKPRRLKLVKPGVLHYWYTHRKTKHECLSSKGESHLTGAAAAAAAAAESILETNP